MKERLRGMWVEVVTYVFFLSCRFLSGVLFMWCNCGCTGVHVQNCGSLRPCSSPWSCRCLCEHGVCTVVSARKVVYLLWCSPRRLCWCALCLILTLEKCACGAVGCHARRFCEAAVLGYGTGCDACWCYLKRFPKSELNVRRNYLHTAVISVCSKLSQVSAWIGVYLALMVMSTWSCSCSMSKGDQLTLTTSCVSSRRFFIW